MSQIRTAQSCATDARTAATEFHRGLAGPGLSLVIFFCSCDYDLDLLTQEFKHLFAGVLLVGCTTAGGYGPQGYREHTLTGVGFAGPDYLAVAAQLQILPAFDPAAARDKIQALRQELETRAPWVQSVNTLALQLIDGLSVKEEIVTRTVQNALGAVFMVGGSAGDGMRFQRTHVFCDGEFHSGRAVLILLATRLPFHLFMTQHFSPREERMVVTRADAAQRLVYELNGRPAAAEYARNAGVDSLDPALFSHIPVMVKLGGKHYVRSIQQVMPDGALRFYCAIEQGMVLRLARGENLTQDLRAQFADIAQALGEPPQLIIACDCILRRLEIQNTGLAAEVDALGRDNHVVGFATYGEQYRGVHINQTLSGIAFGRKQEDDDERQA
ncbi:FIST N-terminal domain-containing protein [Paludibacterium yongneupense]|uniref:FIST N-terminal domain-containing protein n=1 Tax=Paludibacterium yongneupense TaxID=400061 RepID=UPI000426019B|nr:FIST N-terminal domain-containing protein [Paludibacterium yongneupense]